MIGQKIFTIEKNTDTESAIEVYLMLIAAELKSHRAAHYPDQYFTVPTNLAWDYIKLIEDERKRFQTALRGIGSKSSEDFNESYKSQLFNEFEKEKKQTIEEGLEIIFNMVSKQKKILKFKLSENGQISYSPMFRLAQKRADESELITIPKLSNSNLEDVERYLKKVAKCDANIKAMSHIEKHINLTGEYKCRTLVDSVNEIFIRMKSKGEFEKKDSDSNDLELKDYVNKAIREYEIFGKTKFIINDQAYYQSVYNSFKNKLD